MESKQNISILFFLFCGLWLPAQTMRTFAMPTGDEKALAGNDYDALVAIQSDLNFALASESAGENKSGSGSVGVFFVGQKWYGDVNFTVVSAQKEVATEDPATVAPFVNNLLVPQNSGRNGSSFAASLGVNQPLGKWKWLNKKEGSFGGWLGQNTGLYAQFRSNQLIWTKESTSVDVVVNSFAASVVFNVFNFKLQDDDRQFVHFFALAGVVTRRLGGDYGLDANKDLRRHFLGTEALGFNGWEVGAKLELGPFYSKMSLTSFPRKDNLPGFSGDQLLITAGATVELSIKAKNRK